MKVLFMGTPDFAVPTLEALVKSEHEVVSVVTQPDKPKGRGKEIQFTPVKECAVKYNIPVLQPVKVKEEAFLDELTKIDFDTIVVVAFGQILPKRLLDMPKYGCINVHSSLLPAYRGAAPIQWAVVYGETKSGVTTMFMDEGLDTGDILLQKEIELDKEETGGSLHYKLSVIGADLLIETLKEIENGTVKRIKQDESKSNYVGMIDKKTGAIDFNEDAVVIERLIRGLNPWPSAFAKLDNKTIKIWKANVITLDDLKDMNFTQMSDNIEKMENGTVVAVSKDSFVVKTGRDFLECIEVQLEGKKRMDASDFLRGYKLETGNMLVKP
ncbi:MAG: methionyl-tRNA formyltransferase [Lachnospiraceae bacterium]|nr:methionyl-tRNA formyltransferase [Lachnospiraceae bacterium]